MLEYVTDTHPLFWYFADPKKLGRNAKVAFQQMENGSALIYISAIVLCEMHFANVKEGRPVDMAEVFNEIGQHACFQLKSVEPEDVLDFDADFAVPEMHDRMIVGLARRFGLPLITKDESIVKSKLVRIVW